MHIDDREKMTRQQLNRTHSFDSHYFASLVENILADPFAYLGFIGSWYDGREAEVFLPPFPNWSRLHGFIYHVVSSELDERFDSTFIDLETHESGDEPWCDSLLKAYGMEDQGFRIWLKKKSTEIDEITEDQITEYYDELCESGQFDNLITHITNEVFDLLFSNRKVLRNLNGFITIVIEQLSFDSISADLIQFLNLDGTVKPVKIPQWAKRTVFLRDRGICTKCGTDLNSLESSNQELQYDYIVPISERGINDITNIQLLCSDCVLIK